MLRVSILAAAVAVCPGAAAADGLADDFLDLLRNTCLPAIETGQVADLSGMTPYDGGNPDHNWLGPSIGDGYVADDPRLLIAFGERNGYRGCEVFFAAEIPTGDGATIADALEDWIAGHIDGTPYGLVENCPLFGFRLFVAAGSADRNPRGFFVRILATSAVDPDDAARYGNPRAVVIETPEPSIEQCIAEDGAAAP
ncbi:MAG: hypothetical protein H6842_04100 [Rhodospirillaceae bacterium]|nr:hypothetical protein [Rhodospirillaceae bacterium]